MEQKPLLLLDIDGVLNFFGPVRSPHHWTTPHGPYRLAMDRRLPGELKALEEQFEVVWASMWQQHSAEKFAPIFGYGEHLEHIHFSHYRPPLGVSGVGGYKLPGVKAWVGDRPCIWVDDDAGIPAIWDWAAERNREIPTKVIVPRAKHGMLARHIQEIRNFTKRLPPTPASPQRLRTAAH